MVFPLLPRAHSGKLDMSSPVPDPVAVPFGRRKKSDSLSGPARCCLSRREEAQTRPGSSADRGPKHVERGIIDPLAHQLHAPEASRREEAARQLWLRFAERLRALVRRTLDARIRRRADEDDVLQSVFAGYFAAQPGPAGPPRSRAELWRLLVCITMRKVTNTADRHRARRRDLRRERPLDGIGDDTEPAGPADRRRISPDDEAIAREEFARLLAVLPEDLQKVFALRLEGFTNAEIAAQLGRVERTVELKMRAIRGLLGPHLGIAIPSGDR